MLDNSTKFDLLPQAVVSLSKTITNGSSGASYHRRFTIQYYQHATLKIMQFSLMQANLPAGFRHIYEHMDRPKIKVLFMMENFNIFVAS